MIPREKLDKFAGKANEWFDDINVFLLPMPDEMTYSDHDGRWYPSRNEYYQNIIIMRGKYAREFLEFTVWLQDSTIDDCLICLTALTIGMHLKAKDSLDAIKRRGCTDGMRWAWGWHTYDDNQAMA